MKLMNHRGTSMTTDILPRRKKMEKGGQSKPKVPVMMMMGMMITP
jgi:hypothetical protein